MNIPEIRKRLGGVMALARKSGVNHSNLSRILRGRANPSWPSAKRICAAAGVSLDDLDRYMVNQVRWGR